MDNPVFKNVLAASKGQAAPNFTKRSKLEQDDDSSLKKSEGLCKIKYAKVYEKIGSGQFGSVFDIGNGQVAKVESCHRANSQFPSKTGGFESEVKQMKAMTKVLEKAGYAPKIIKYASCGSNCITIMEKVEGGKPLKQAIVDRPEQLTELIGTLCKMIKWCQSQWAEMDLKTPEGKPVGHGDLHLGNVLLDIRDMKLKIIDYSFSRKLDQKYDWFFLFEHIGDVMAQNPKLKSYKRDVLALIKENVPEEHQSETKEKFFNALEK